MLHDLQHKNFVNSAQFSPDGKYIVSASRDKTAKIWEVASGKLLHVLRGHTFGLSSAQFSPDGKFIVTTSCDQTAKIWDVSTGKLIQKLIHTGCVSQAFFSPDGNYIVTASEDGTVNIWNLTSGKLLHVLRGHTSMIKSAQFSPDGKSILTTSSDHKTILWDAATGKMRYARLQLSNNDWLVYDEHNRYDGSPGARDYLYFVCGIEIVDLSLMKDTLYVPGLVEKIMNGEEINSPRLSELDICKTSK
jgi:WD40 repeat protein